MLECSLAPRLTSQGPQEGLFSTSIYSFLICEMGSGQQPRLTGMPRGMDGETRTALSSAGSLQQLRTQDRHGGR